MAKITPTPLMFWASGSDVLARVDRVGVHIGRAEQEDLLRVFEDERRAAEAARDPKAWLAALCKAHQLTNARMQARRWDRASGFAA